MRVRKLKEGKRRVGEVVVSREESRYLREVAVGVIENYWSPTDSDIDVTDRNPICQNAGIVAYPGSENVYCYISVKGDIIEVPDKTFLFKLLQIL